MEITTIITSVLTLLAGIGALGTAAIQSSSVMTSIALAMDAYQNESLDSLDRANVIEEEIADHMINIAKSIRSLKGGKA